MLFLPMDVTNTSIIIHVNIKYDVKSFSHKGSFEFAIACKVSRIAAAFCLLLTTCLHGCCCSISAVRAVRVCGFFLQLTCSCHITQHGGWGAYPSSSLFFLSSTPPIFSFTRSLSQRQAQTRQGN